ncbi:lysozyme inhibitor LprI family protein [Paraclostridium tenue]
MKKVIISIGLIMALVLTGCAKDEKKQSKKVATAAYCNNCGKESKEETKLCSNCGKEATWLTEKPEISKDKKKDIEKKDENKDTIKDIEKKDENKDTTKDIVKKDKNKDTTKDIVKKDENKDTTKDIVKKDENKDTIKDIAKKDKNKDTTKDVETVKHSYKDEYINKLNSTEEGMSDLDYLYKSGTNGELVEAEYTRLKRWDNMLNEIYSLLKTQLTESEMNELKSKQRSWIEYRDKTAENEASENRGGSLYYVVYNGSLARLTKERCYELVNTYMK